MELRTRTRVRRGVPEDAAALAEVCYMAGRSHCERSIYDLFVPGPYGCTPERLSFLEGVLRTEYPCWMHCTKFLVAEVDGRVAAGLSAFSREEAGNRHFGRAFAEVGWEKPDFLAMAERMSPYLKVDPPKPDGVWVVENVAAFPQFRRRGLINRLLEEALELGRSRGHALAQVSIITGNTPAQRAYEKVGFRVYREYADPSFQAFFGWPGMTCLRLPL